MFAAILDTNVLWPSLQRDFLLSMAVEGLYRPLWSEAILEELHLHEQLKLIDRGSDEAAALASAERLVDRMRANFADALVTGWEPLDGTFGLPDCDDEHVLAAAVIGGAGAIVTDNAKHFPAELVPNRIQVLHAKDFAGEHSRCRPWPGRDRAARPRGPVSHPTDHAAGSPEGARQPVRHGRRGGDPLRRCPEYAG